MSSQSWRYPLILIAVSFIVYGSTTTFDFVNYDDPDLVYQNEKFLGDISNVFTSFTTHAFTSHRKESVYYRPVLLVSYIADYQIWKLNPAGYHLSNIILHVLAVVALFHLLRNILTSPAAALAGALIFAVHPIQTESVAWVAGRNDILLGIFIILMMLSHDLSYRDQGRRQFLLALSAASFLIALLTKESAAFYLLLIPIYDFLIQGKSKEFFLSSAAGRQYTLMGVILLAYLGLRFSIFGEVVGAERLYGNIPIFDRVLQIPAIAAEHARLLLVPVNLSVVHPLESLMWFSSPWNAIAVILIAVYAGVMWWMWSRDRLLVFGMFWIVVGFLPVLNVFPVAVPILEHRLYAVMPGLALVACRIIAVRTATEHRSLVIGGIVVVLLGAMAFKRLPVWKSSESLWLDAIEKAPAGSRAYFNLAGFYFEQGRYDTTAQLLVKYLALKPEDAFALDKLRQSYFLTGKYPEAAGVSRRLIELTPANPDRYLEAGLLFERLNMPDSAMALYTEGLRADSTSFKLHLQMGVLLESISQPGPASESYRRAIRYSPQYGPPYFRLGRLLASQGDVAGGIRTIEEGMKVWRPSAEVVAFLKELYEKSGQHEKAQQLTR